MGFNEVMEPETGVGLCACHCGVILWCFLGGFLMVEFVVEFG